MKDDLRIRPRRIVGNFLSTPENTNVIARTTDAFIGVNKDTRASDDAKMIEGLVGATVKVGAQARQMNAEEDALKGRNDAVLGKEMDAPSGLFHSTKAYTEAYQGVKDEAQGIRFRDEYLNILRENDYFINTADPEAQQQDLYKTLYENHFGGDYLTKHGRDGLLTDRGLARIEEAKLVSNSEFIKRGVEYRKEGFLNDSYTLVSDVVDTMLGAKSISSDMLSASIDSNFEDYVKNNGNIISKAEYQGIMLDKLGQKAKEKARLGDVDGAKNMVEMVRGLRDKEGSLYDRITGSDAKDGKIKYGFRGTIDNLENEVQQEITAVERAKKAAEVEAQEQTYAQYIVGVSDLTNEGLNISGRHSKVASLRDQLQQDIVSGKIKPSQGKTLLNKLDDMYNQRGTKKSDSNALRSAIAYVNRPDADFDTFVNTYGSGLSDKDFLQFANKFYTNQKQYSNEFDSATKKVYSEYRDDLKKGKGRNLNPNTIFAKYDDKGELRETLFNTTFEATVDNFMKTNGKAPSIMELTEISNKAEELALKQYPIKSKKGGSNGSGESTNTGNSGEPDFGGLD